jgi:predicted DNA-binding transcriptional regulator YafY
MRASRLVNLLLLLQTRGQMTARELSRELEVSERTIYRDVDALSASGVPIYAERGPLGGIRLVEGYRTRLTGLTADEAEALFLSGLPGPAAELGLGTVVAAARLKVLAALPPELRNRASRITERFHIDAPGWFQSPDVVPHLSDLASAVWETRKIRLTYRRPDRVGAVTRETEPLGIVLKGGIWYLVARTAGQFRTYRVSRTIAVEATPETFERPSGFDLARHWAGSIAAYEKDFERVDLVLRIPGDRLDEVWCVVGRDRAHIGPAEPDGTHVVRAAFEWDDEALTAAIRLSPVADVLEPASVRASMEAFARAILARRVEPATDRMLEPVGAAPAG